MAKNKKENKKTKWWRPSKGFAVEVNDEELRKLQASESQKEVPVILKINQDTDVSITLRNPFPDEKIIKLSNVCKNKSSWLETLFAEKPRHYYRFICLTTAKICLPIVSYDKSYKRWKTGYETDFDIPNMHLISAHASKVKGRDNLIINYKSDKNETKQLKLPVDNPEEWLKEINAVIEKAR